MPNAYFPVEVDYGDNTEGPALKLDDKCDLPMPVQRLVVQIFDINLMKRTLLEFEVTLLTILYSSVTFHTILHLLKIELFSYYTRLIKYIIRHIAHP